MNRLEEEKKVVGYMITIYCRDCHRGANSRLRDAKKVEAEDSQADAELCEECAELLEYAYNRLEYCPNVDVKKSCRKCSTHCYAPYYRNRIRAVMRYSGPRMILLHPIAAIRHIWREL